MRTLNKVALVTVVAIHYIVVACFALTAVLAFYAFVWYAAVTVTALVVRVAVDPAPCPLTVMENKLREKLGYAHNIKFVKHYVLRAPETLIGLYIDLKLK